MQKPAPTSKNIDSGSRIVFNSHLLDSFWGSVSQKQTIEIHFKSKHRHSKTYRNKFPYT